MRPLTRSGAGVLLEDEDLERADCVTRLQHLLDQARFAVIRGALRSQPAAVELMSRFGPINNAKTRKDGAVVVTDQEQEEVFRSSFALPLHKDGVLTGFDVVLVGIYCVAFRDVTGGRTFVSDAERALEALPSEHVAVLRENGMEAMALDRTGYYRPEFEGRWQPFPALKACPGRRETLNIGLPHAAGEPASWEVRVAGVSEEHSNEILTVLRRVLLAEEYLYFHDWQEGDILVMDNYRVMHGREAFEGRQRTLANIQVLAT